MFKKIKPFLPFILIALAIIVLIVLMKPNKSSGGDGQRKLGPVGKPISFKLSSGVSEPVTYEVLDSKKDSIFTKTISMPSVELIDINIPYEGFFKITYKGTSTNGFNLLKKYNNKTVIAQDVDGQVKLKILQK